MGSKDGLAGENTGICFKMVKKAVKEYDHKSVNRRPDTWYSSDWNLCSWNGASLSAFGLVSGRCLSYYR